MKIKLFARDIEPIKVDDNSRQLDTSLVGVCKNYENKIYFDNSHPFVTLLHEIKHTHIFAAGYSQLNSYTREGVCDTFAACIDQLMLENGNDIFIKLKDFAEE